MTNETILKKAIEKAVENGFKYLPMLFCDDESKISKISEISIYNNIIFNHRFAKAFWGEKEILKPGPGFWINQVAWKYHLREMVLEENPILYLKDFI